MFQFRVYMELSETSLQDEAKPIKAALYAEYGAAIDRELEAARRGQVQLFDGRSRRTALDEYRERLDEIVQRATPTQIAMSKCREEALSKLTTLTQEASTRGEDVGHRLRLLQQLQLEEGAAA